MNELEKEREEEVVQPKLRVIQGGRAGFDGSGATPTCWLNRLSVGDCFLAKSKDPMEFLEQQWEILVKFEDAIKLFSNIGPHEVETWVHPDSFCRKFSLVRVLSNGDSD